MKPSITFSIFVVLGILEGIIKSVHIWLQYIDVQKLQYQKLWGKVLFSGLLLFLALSGVQGKNGVTQEVNRHQRVYDSLFLYNPDQVAPQLIKLHGFLALTNLTDLQRVNILAAHCHWYELKKDCDSASYFALLALASSNDSVGKVRACLAMGEAHRCYKKTDSALTYYFQAERMAFRLQDTFGLIRSYFYLGHIHSDLGKFEQADKYYRISNLLAQTSGDDEFMIRTDLALARNLGDRNYIKEASFLLQRALLLCKTKGLIRQQAIACNNLGWFYQQLGSYKMAIHYYEESLQLQVRIGNLHEQAIQYCNIASIYMTQNQGDKAIPLLLKAKELCEKLQKRTQLPEIYHNLASAYAIAGNFEEAFFYKEEQRLLNDSLRSIEMLKHTERLQEEFETEKRQLEITNLKQENDVKELKNIARTRQRNVFIGLAAGLLCVALLVFFLLRQRVRNARQVNEKNIQIHQQQMDEVMRKSELQSIHTMLETQEKERKRIAEDLHDRVGSMLSTVRLQFSKFSPTAAPQQSGQFEKVAHLLDDTLEEIRQVSHNLVSGVLSTFGLLPALNDLAQALRDSSQLQINIQSHGIDTRMETDTEIHIYRMLQELFNNTIRHAQATEVNIDLSRFGNQLTLMYSDNGRGFDTTTLQQAGIGLKNMYSRVEKLNGSLHIDSGKGNGSTFIFTIQLT